MAARLQAYAGWRIVLADTHPSTDGHARYLPHREGADASDQCITGVYRRGKHLVFALERGALLCHNAMSGYWDSASEPWSFDYVEGKRESRETDVRASLLVIPPGLSLAPSEKVTVLRFHDARKFGSLRYVSPEGLAEKLSKLGPDALRTPCLYEPTATMSLEQFRVAVGNSKHPVKARLMEQDVIAGVGNIYATEACWMACLDPHRPGTDLAGEQLATLFGSVKTVLQWAISRRLDYGALNIYRRKKCARGCGGETKSEKLGGRTTWWCPTCQK